MKEIESNSNLGNNGTVVSFSDFKKIETSFSKECLRFILSKKTSLEKLICILEVLSQDTKLKINIKDIAYFLRITIKEVEELALEMFVDDRHRVAMMILEMQYFLKFKSFLEGQTYEASKSFKEIVMQVSVDYSELILDRYENILLHREDGT